MFYVLDEKGNKVEAYDKQGVLALLEQAIEEGSLADITSDSAFITKLKCCVGTGTHHIAFVPQATYNELKENGQLLADAYYFITDDTTTEDINQQLEELTNTVNTLMNALTVLSSKVNKELIYSGDTLIPYKVSTHIPLLTSIEDGDVLEIYCTIKVSSTPNTASGYVCGKVRISKDNFFKSQLIYSMNNYGIDGGCVGTIVISFSLDATPSYSITVYFDNPSFTNSSTPAIGALTGWQVRIDKIYKLPY